MRFLVLILCFLPLFVGCGERRPRRVPVQGTVFVDGQPLAGEYEGFVRLYSNDGRRPSSGSIDSRGHFVLGNYDEADGCQPGEYQVEVSATIMDGPQKVKHLIPPRYGSVETSDLTLTISKEVTDLKIETEWKPEDKKYKNRFVKVN